MAQGETSYGCERQGTGLRVIWACWQQATPYNPALHPPLFELQPSQLDSGTEALRGPRGLRSAHENEPERVSPDP
jgi:hypothetical protein